MIKDVFWSISLLVSLWILGLVVCLVYYGLGGSGTDALSEHYRFIISLVI